ncbi:MAG: MBL fold metallo-hydrolase, partial [Treponema sp.]|nr:MBL fold metallo-hydrolase [Treponema sp.]
MKITVLGSGTSNGIPVVGCECPVCTSGDIRDKRMRASVFIEGAGGEKALIDTGPEFRLQAVRAGIKRLDAIFLTHSHADHIHGLDDVRPLSMKKPIPVYGNEPSIAEMKERFSYIWKKTQLGGGKPKISPFVVDQPLFPGKVQLGELTFIPVPVKHGVMDILGWEVLEGGAVISQTDGLEKPSFSSAKSFLYLTDTSAIPPASLEWLLGGRQSRVIIIGGLRMKPSETHFTFDEALNTAVMLGGKAIYLT